MEILEIALIGPPANAMDCFLALVDAGFQADIADAGPGRSGINTFNPRLLEELDVVELTVIDVDVYADSQLAEVQAAAAPHGFTLRLHGWVTQ